jgi:anti-anti-sigma regulatory factor
MNCELQVGPISGGTLVRLVGRGTMCESPVFRDTVEQRLERGFVVFDASDCNYLDSTFLGCLIGLKKACECDGHGRLLVAASPDTRIKLFCTSSLHQYFDFVDVLPELTGPLECVDLTGTSRGELGSHVMTCHERLAEMGGREAPAFRAIADRLARELGGRVSVE